MTKGPRRGRPVLVRFEAGRPHMVRSTYDDLMWLVISASPNQAGTWFAEVHGPQPGHGSYGNVNVVLVPDGDGYWMDLHVGTHPDDHADMTRTPDDRP